jgi:hypothetical protein
MTRHAVTRRRRFNQRLHEIAERVWARKAERHASAIYRAQLDERPSQDDEIARALRQEGLLK